MGCCAGRSQNAASCYSIWLAPAVQCQHYECCGPELICTAASSFLTPEIPWSKHAKLHVGTECDVSMLCAMTELLSVETLSCAMRSGIVTWVMQVRHGASKCFISAHKQYVTSLLWQQAIQMHGTTFVFLSL